MGKQNIQAKKVFSMDAKKVLAFFVALNTGTYHTIRVKRVERGFTVIYVFFFFRCRSAIKAIKPR